MSPSRLMCFLSLPRSMMCVTIIHLLWVSPGSWDVDHDLPTFYTGLYVVIFLILQLHMHTWTWVMTFWLFYGAFCIMYYHLAMLFQFDSIFIVCTRQTPNFSEYWHSDKYKWLNLINLHFDLSQRVWHLYKHSYVYIIGAFISTHKYGYSIMVTMIQSVSLIKFNHM